MENYRGRGSRGGYSGEGRGGRGGYSGEGRGGREGYSGEYRGGRGGREGYSGEGRGSHTTSGPIIPTNRQIKLTTNMYPVEIKQNLEEITYRYEVDFFNMKGEKITKMNKMLRNKIVTDISKEMEKITPFAYDGMATLFTLKSMKRIPEIEPPKDFFEKVTEIDKQGIHYMIDLKDKKGKIVVQLKPAQITNNKNTELQMLQIAIQYSSYRQYDNQIIRGNNVYNISKAEKFVNKYIISDLMLFTGIFQSFRNTKIGLILNVDVSYYVAIGAYTMVDWFELTAKKERYRSLGEAFNDKYFRDMLNKEIKGMEIKVTYGTKRKYKVESIDFDNTAKTATFTIFELDNKKATLIEYMKYKYNIHIKNDSLPLIIIKSKLNNGPNWIVPECCYFSEGQRRRSILSAEERSFMIDKTRSFPKDRFDNISLLTKDITANNYFNKFPIKIDYSNPIITDARVLDPLNLDFFKNKGEPDNKGSWNFYNKKFVYVENRVYDWAIIFPPKFYDRLDDFLNGFIKVASNLGMSLIQKPYKMDTRGNSTDDYIDTLKYCTTLKTVPDFILIVLPDQNSHRYKTVKNFADLDLQLPSKCLIADDKNRFLQPGFQSNVLASLNVKLGNFNWSIPMDRVQSWLSHNNSRISVMGLDVCHGNTFSNIDNSVVALCASLNSTFTTYHTSIAYQSARREIVVDLKDLFYDCLKTFFLKNDFLPSDILFYRDGVGEGMYNLVRDYEISQIYAACDDAYADLKLPNPRISYVVVQKRHHLRAIWTTDNNSFNPPYGAFINSTVIDSSTKNFYLYSHFAMQGTARPTHYQILFDDCGFADNIIPFTFALAHLHQGCPKSISIPAPVFYADSAAARVFDYYYGAKQVPGKIQDGFTV